MVKKGEFWCFWEGFWCVLCRFVVEQPHGLARTDIPSRACGTGQADVWDVVVRRKQGRKRAGWGARPCHEWGAEKGWKRAGQGCHGDSGGTTRSCRQTVKNRQKVQKMAKEGRKTAQNDQKFVKC